MNLAFVNIKNPLKASELTGHESLERNKHCDLPLPATSQRPAALVGFFLHFAPLFSSFSINAQDD